MSVNKITAERNNKILLELVQKPGNDTCADCKARNPRWASHNLGIFLCMNCASIHRKIGTHITKVKSVTMDSWTKEQTENMKEIGNLKSNAIYNPNEAKHPPPLSLMDGERDSEMEQYIRSKYEYKRFIDKNALVASKLGPSRSAASVEQTRPKSSPLVSNPARGPSPNPPASRPLTTAPTQSQTALTTPAPSFSQPRSSSLPMTSMLGQSMQSPLSRQPAQAPAPKDGVWADLVSLQGPSVSSSLPLQYSSQLTFGTASQQPAPQFGSTLAPNFQMNTGLTPNGFASANATNPFQQMQMQPQMTSNPFAQQPSASFPPPSFALSMTAMQPPFQLQSSWGMRQQQQPMFTNQTMVQSPITEQRMPSLQQPQQPILAPQAQFGAGGAPGMGQFHTPSPQPPFMQSTTPQMNGGAMMSTTPQPAPFNNGGFGGGFGPPQGQQIFGQQPTGYPNMMGQGQWGSI